MEHRTTACRATIRPRTTRRDAGSRPGIWKHWWVRGSSVWLLLIALPAAPSSPPPLDDTPPPPSVSPGSFGRVGNLLQARAGAQATLLSDGTVLVTGGYQPCPLGATCPSSEIALASAERFDPQTSQFTAVDGMLSAHDSSHRAVRLADGRVLVIGGYGVRGVEIFDPSTRQFTPAGVLSRGPGGFTATLLHDGRVLVAGGQNPGEIAPTASAELFDPASGRSVATGTMTTPRFGHAAVLLPDGRVAILGGRGSGGQELQSVEIYDPQAGTFSPAGGLVQGRANMAASLLPDGRILVAGGHSGQAIEIYNPATGQSAITGTLNDYRGAFAAVPLAQGRLLMAGGVGEGGRFLGTAELLDPRADSVSPSAAMTIASATVSMAAERARSAAVALTDGRVLVLGGVGPGGDALDSAELYSPAPPASFQPVGRLAQGRFDAEATLLTDGRVLVSGGATWLPGKQNATALASAELFDPNTNQFTSRVNMLHRREHHAALRLQDGRVLVVGGDWTVREAEIFDPATGQFTPTGSLAIGRDGPTATLLPDGRVLVAGGTGSSGGPTPTAELFDPKSGKFRATGAMTTPRWAHAAVALPDGRVVILGGFGGSEQPGRSGQVLRSVEIYDPQTERFQARGSLVATRMEMGASLLPDGRILVVGGTYDYNSADGSFVGVQESVEIYDPSSGQSVVTDILTDARTSFTMAPLPDGRILVAGGRGTELFLRTTEVIDPGTGMASPAAPMTTGRSRPAGVGLQDGRILVLGGMGAPSTALDTAEVYVPARP
jgi:Kelch motif protein/galactose oxidase-like protein